jgi:hypothetical protein
MSSTADEESFDGTATVTMLRSTRTWTVLRRRVLRRTSNAITAPPTSTARLSVVVEAARLRFDGRGQSFTALRIPGPG